ncbi:polysaccharide pyruvyl transferase family protein [Roseomonas sp. CCTCC AB2023176]|uniref:polysaccharide pyruvyl transferase family protein n=1 Tax=Roseomonas sp. CCTCC AB2023176 TaxID=3342640 RepID=UPI0035DBBAD1
MAARVAYLAENFGTVARAWERTVPDLLLATGGNTGNLAFWYAARLLFDAEEIHLISRNTRAAAIPKDVEVVVIPAANFLNAGADLGRLAELIRAIGRPCLVVGLGAQAEQETAPPKLTDGTLDFLREVSRLSPTICIRGAFTQEFCRGLGVENTTVLGCPSLLINPDPRLGERLEQGIAALPATGPVAVHAACIKPGIQSVERELARLVLLNPGSAYLVQRPVEMMKAIYGQLPDGPGEGAYFKRCAEFLGFGTPDGLAAFLRTHGQIPSSVDAWADSLRRFVAGVNTRIHGTMMGVAAGLPSLCICHDTRTRELARQLRVPHIGPREVIENRFSVPALFAAAGFSGASFDEGRREAAAGYADVVRAVGLTPSRHLLRFLEPDRVTTSARQAA